MLLFRSPAELLLVVDTTGIVVQQYLYRVEVLAKATGSTGLLLHCSTVLLLQAPYDGVCRSAIGVYVDTRHRRKLLVESVSPIFDLTETIKA